MLGNGSPRGNYHDPKRDLPCAVCRKPFRGRWRRGLLWCPGHRHFVCSACWHRCCLPAHVLDPARSHPSNAVFGVFWILIWAWMILPFVAVGLHDFGTAVYWKGLEPEPIDSLPDSGTVKVAGIMISNRPVVLGGREHWFGDEYGGEWKWDWNASDEFWLEDMTGRVRVDPSRYYRIEPAHHRAPNARYSEGTAYFANDSVIAVGVVESAGGAKVLRLLCLHPSDTVLEVPSHWGFLGFAGIGLYAEGAIWYWRTHRERRRLHAEATATLIFSLEPPRGFHFDPDPAKERKRRAGFCLSVLAGLAVIGAALLLWRPHTATDMYWLASLVFFTMATATLPGMVLLFDDWNRPIF